MDACTRHMDTCTRHMDTCTRHMDTCTRYMDACTRYIKMRVENFNAIETIFFRFSKNSILFIYALACPD